MEMHSKIFNYADDTSSSCKDKEEIKTARSGLLRLSTAKGENTSFSLVGSTKV